MFLLFVLAAAAPVPASEASLDAFMAAVPPKSSKAAKTDAADAELLGQLKAKNPKHEAEIAATFDAFVQCKTKGGDRFTLAIVRESAKILGDDAVRRLTSFYNGPDYAAFTRLSAKKDSEWTAEEKASIERIMARYPLQDLSNNMAEVSNELLSNGAFFAALEECDQLLEAELTRRQLKK